MQVLQSKEFVPNRTLERLIQIWSDSIQHERVDSLDSPSRLISTREQVVEIIRNADWESKAEALDSISKIACFARDNDENKKSLVGIDGFVPLLVEFLGNGEKIPSRGIELLEQMVRVLEMIRNHVEDRQQLTKSALKRENANILASLLLILQQGSLEGRIGSARILEFLAVDTESKLKIAENDRLLLELLKLICPKKDPTLIDAGLSALISISMSRRIRMKLVQNGAVRCLSKTLTEQNLSVSITEKVLKLLETVSSVKEARSEICENSICIAAIVQKLLKVSNIATEHAVTILWSICYLFRDRKAQEAVMKANGLTKILLLMQSNCSPAVRQMSSDLLKILRINSKYFISCYDTNTTHIMPF